MAMLKLVEAIDLITLRYTRRAFHMGKFKEVAFGAANSGNVKIMRIRKVCKVCSVSFRFFLFLIYSFIYLFIFVCVCVFSSIRWRLHATLSTSFDLILRQGF